MEKEMKKMIEVCGVTKMFRGNVLFSDVNLTVEKGTIVGFKGRNGVGKSVFLKLVAGLYAPDEGGIFVRGEKLGERHDYPDGMGIMIDAPEFIGALSGYENLEMLAEINGRIDGEKIKGHMEKWGLPTDRRKRVKNYSMGMKAKLGVIQATMEGQDIIVLDEPFNALDEASCRQLYDYLLDLKKGGATVLLTSHNQQDLDALCDVQYAVPEFAAERRGGA